MTTRNPCVGNGDGVAPEEVLARAMADHEMAERRQIGVIALDGRSAQHTGSGNSAWAGHRSGATYVV